MLLNKPSDKQLEYWESILHDHRLGMDRGRREWLVYGHEYLDCDPANEELEDTE